MPDEPELALTPPIQPDDVLQRGLKCVFVDNIPCPAVLGKCVEEELVMVAEKDTSVHEGGVIYKYRHPDTASHEKYPQ